MSGPILSPEDIAVLQRTSHITIEAGWMEVSRLALQKLNEEPFIDLHDERPDLIRLPTHLHSVQTFQYLSFTPEIAARLMAIWDRLSAPEKGAGNAFRRIATARIRDADVDAGGLDEEWHGAMTSMGFNTDTQARIMDPEFVQVRLTETCVYWAIQGVKDRYDSLLYEQERSRARSRA